MNNFVVKFGGFIVDIMAIITIIGLIISTVKITIAQGLWAGLGVLWAGLVSFIFVFFLICFINSIGVSRAKTTLLIPRFSQNLTPSKLCIFACVDA